MTTGRPSICSVETRRLSVVPRVHGLMRSGIRRQTRLGNIGLVLAALVGKI